VFTYPRKCGQWSYIKGKVADYNVMSMHHTILVITVKWLKPVYIT